MIYQKKFVLTAWLLSFWISFSSAADISEFIDGAQAVSHLGGSHDLGESSEAIKSGLKGKSSVEFKQPQDHLDGHNHIDLNEARDEFRTEQEKITPSENRPHPVTTTQPIQQEEIKSPTSTKINGEEVKRVGEEDESDPFEYLKRGGKNNKKLRPPNPDHVGKNFWFPVLADEWKIKTWTRKVWRPVKDALMNGITGIFAVIALPFRNIIKTPAKYTDRVHPMIFRMNRNPIGVWEKTPKTGWKLPDLPPAYSNDEVIRRAYLRGEELTNTRSNSGRLELLKHYAKEDNIDDGIRYELVTSKSYGQMLSDLYTNRVNLYWEHEEMKKVLEEIVTEWKSPERVSDLFREMLKKWKPEGHVGIYLAKAGEEIGEDTPKTIPPKPREDTSIGGVALDSRDPSAYEMHLSPLLTLTRDPKPWIEEGRVIESTKFTDFLTSAGIATGYHPDGSSRIEKLVEKAKKVERYSEFSGSVHKSQFAVKQYLEKLKNLRKSDLIEPEKVRKTFEDIAKAEEIPPRGYMKA